MERKQFIRNTLMALCISLVPKNLLPVDGEIVEEEVYEFDGIIPSIERWVDRHTVGYVSSDWLQGVIKVINEDNKWRNQCESSNATMIKRLLRRSVQRHQY
jgi:hypothetical protein